MYTTPSINFEYLFVRIYDLFSSGGALDITTIPHTLLVVIGDVTIIGWVVAILFFITLVYLRIRIVQVEEIGFAYKQEQLERQHAHAERTGTNTRWDTIVALANSPQEGDWRRAILDADIMLSEVLEARGYTGETLGDQLKNANPLQFTTIDVAWEAHKMRNTIAHLGEAFPLTERDVRATIDAYRRVFEELSVV